MFEEEPKPEPGEEAMFRLDPYWDTDQMYERDAGHYADHYCHARDINVMRE